MSLLGIIIGLVIIGLMMLVHEAGHFFAGRLLNFKIIEFSIFMGPRIFSTEKDGIKYSFKLL
ncbi:MAG TPA: site-2 protease family protein, partial [Candidatus Eisenbacteria bacterium]|nr:site-2 protease family protein [Candidatus Eisenbacteria bacterium]